MTAKSRQRHDTLDLLPFFSSSLVSFLSLRRNDTYILSIFLIFIFTNGGVLDFVSAFFSVYLSTSFLFMITSLSKRVLIAMAGFWQGRREGVIEAGEFILFFMFFLLLSSLPFFFRNFS